MHCEGALDVGRMAVTDLPERSNEIRVRVH